jgi:hypothetical protein
MSSKQQTAVQWYIEESENLRVKYITAGASMTREEYDIFEQRLKSKALAMEREQIVHAYNIGLHRQLTGKSPQMGKTYYRETYGEEQSNESRQTE